MRLFNAMKKQLIHRAQNAQNHGISPAYEPNKSAVFRTTSLTTSTHPQPSTIHNPATARASARSVASLEESETSSEEYSPSENSSSYTGGTGGSAKEWPLPLTPSPIPGSMDRPPPIPPRVGNGRPFSPCSMSSSSSSSHSGYQVTRTMSQPFPDTRAHYMKLTATVDLTGDGEYMTMNRTHRLVDEEEEAGYTDMQSAGSVPLYDSTPDDLEYVVNSLHEIAGSGNQCGTLTRNHLGSLPDRPPSSSISLDSLRLKDCNLGPSIAGGSCQTLPCSSRT